MLLSPHAATLAAGTVSGILPDQTGSFQECSEIAIDDGVDKILKDVDGELHLVRRYLLEKPLRSRLLDSDLLKSVDATLRLFLNAQIGQRAIGQLSRVEIRGRAGCPRCYGVDEGTGGAS